MRFVKVFFFLLFFILLPKPSFAQNDSFITIVNPVRISTYTENSLESLLAEYEEVKKRELPASWLLTHDAIRDESISKVVGEMDENQELGIFLEVTENFANSAGVEYRRTDSWHRASSLFLSGYAQKDRKKLIDKAFKDFKNSFGYYPKSVGGWWVDSFSLAYMKEKYEITGVLGMSDQYSLDGYSLWGTHWSTPFYPSKINAAVPSNDDQNRLEVLTFRWAARDPLNGYKNEYFNPAYFSVQDFSLTGQTNEYRGKLMETYALRKQYNPFGQITIGLEADYSPETYKNSYSSYLDSAMTLVEQGAHFLTMKDFSVRYRDDYSKTRDSFVVESDDFLGSQKKAIWIQNDSYRVGIIHDYKNNKTQVVDLRIYSKNLKEPFYVPPNGQYDLNMLVPFVIDSSVLNDSAWELELGKILDIRKEEGTVFLVFEKGILEFGPNEILIPGSKIPEFVESSDQLEVEKSLLGYSLIPKKNYPISEDGELYSDFFFEVPFSIRTRTGSYLPLVVVLALVVSILIFRLKIFRTYSKYFAVICLFFLSTFILYQVVTKYYISQHEIDGLKVLSQLPDGKVLAYRKDCLRCKFVTTKPASAKGIKSYVGKFSNKEVFKDDTFLLAKDSKTARQVLTANKISYIYLSKYEDYIEALPYLPQDIGVKKVYENANSAIWKVE